MTDTASHEIERVEPGIEGVALVTHGGLPRGRLSLVAGTAGSGKTVFAVQFLAHGIDKAGEPGVFVTFEERPEAIRRNFRSFGWDITEWEDQGNWAFVDASPQLGDETTVAGDYDLSALVVRVRHAVESVGARRVAIDSTGSLIDQFPDVVAARRALFQVATELESLGVTSVMTAERLEDHGAISKHGFEEFVSDNVIILRNALEAEKRRRTLEVLKMRGGSHLRGEHLFTLLPQRGMVVLPQEEVTFGWASSRERLTTGVDELDAMCGGGLFDKSLTLVSGATGTGKSMLSSLFVAGGARQGQRAILFSFEESRDQLARNAAAWGMDFDEMARDDRLRVVSIAPEARSLEDHLLRLKAEIIDFAPDRVAIDSLTALERIATARSFSEYLLGLSFYIKSRGILGLVTTTAESLVAGLSGGPLHVSTVSDTVILLHYVGDRERIRRGITVLKMRGSDHDKAIREFTIDDAGMHIGDALAMRAWSHLPSVL